MILNVEYKRVVTLCEKYVSHTHLLTTYTESCEAHE